MGIPGRDGRWCSLDPPAHSGSPQIVPRIEPYQPQRHTVLFRRQPQPARGGEIERAWVSRDLSDHERKVTATQALLQRKQSVLRRAGRNMDQAMTHLRRETRQIGPARQAQRRLVLHPQEQALVGRICRRIRRCHPQGITRKGKGQPGACSIATAREHFCMTATCSNARTPMGRTLTRADTSYKAGGQSDQIGRSTGFSHTNRVLCSYYVPNKETRNPPTVPILCRTWTMGLEGTSPAPARSFANTQHERQTQQ